MPNDTQRFTLTPTLEGGTVQWEMCYVNTNTCSANGNFPYVVLGADKGVYAFEYTINDQGGLGIVFGDDPITFKKGEPVGPGKPKQIVDIDGDGTNQLTFRDNNNLPNKQFPDPVVMDYQLNFKTTQPIAGGGVPPIDPIIINGGTKADGPPAPSGGVGIAAYSSEYWILLGLVFLAALIGAFIAGTLKPQR